MQHSEEIGEIGKAMTKMQGEVTPALKDETGAFSTYSTLKSVITASRKALVDNGLAVVQSPSMDPETGFCVLTTLLIHGESGQWISGSLAMKPEKTGPQAVGATVSYQRRYSLAAFLGIYQEDDDAEAATDTSERPTPPKKATPRAASPRAGAATKTSTSNGNKVVETLVVSVLERETKAGSTVYDIHTKHDEENGMETPVSTFKEAHAEVATECLQKTTPSPVRITYKERAVGTRVYRDVVALESAQPLTVEDIPF